MSERRKRLAKVLAEQGLGDKPVWLTETGSSSDASLQTLSKQRGSPAQQAADVFRRSLIAWGNGDQAVFWHTHMSSPNRPNNRWRGYGLRDSDGKKKPAYTAFQLLSEHIAPFASIAPVEGLKPGQYGYHITLKSGPHRWVYWGAGTTLAPVKPSAKGYASVVPGEDGRHAWRAVPDELVLSDVPYILRN